MRKSRLLILLVAIILCSRLSIAADSKTVVVLDPVPVVEAVPAPAVLPEDLPADKVSKNIKGVSKGTKLGLIKTEKVYVDKSCRMVNAKLKCKNKKTKRNIIESDKNIRDLNDGPPSPSIK